MKAIIYNTGFDADDIKSGEKKVVESSEAEALVEKWGGMMKILPYEEPKKPEVEPVKEKPKKVAKESVLKKTIKKLKK
jgi:hypothetical protein